MIKKIWYTTIVKFYVHCLNVFKREYRESGYVKAELIKCVYFRNKNDYEVIHIIVGCSCLLSNHTHCYYKKKSDWLWNYGGVHMVGECPHRKYVESFVSRASTQETSCQPMKEESEEN